MPYDNDPANNPISRVRLLVGDVFQDFEILDDATYQYFLDKNNGNETAAAVAAAKVIRFQIAKAPYREKAGQYEVWDKFAELYTTALNDLIDDIGNGNFVAIPYAGGISRRDMLLNDLGRDVVGLCLPKLGTCPFPHWIWNSQSFADYSFDC